ncbi:hypothetical protein [Flavobacterium sp.]|uniref:hypothetical protein n=1 Tax=Flavobacterium sp. TaxID=239 RepID=UPI0026396783|nr:hypothetical protein [Flavobacterium sp.]
MKKVVLFLIISILFSFTQKNNISDGNYVNIDNNEYIYGLNINTELNQVKLYFYQDGQKPIKDWKNFNSGKLVKIKNKYFIQDFESNLLPSSRDKQIEIKIKNNIIEFDSYKLLHNFYPNFVVFSSRIKFTQEIKSN